MLPLCLLPPNWRTLPEVAPRLSKQRFILYCCPYLSSRAPFVVAFCIGSANSILLSCPNGAIHGRPFGPFEILSRLSDCLSVRCTGFFFAKITNTHVFRFGWSCDYMSRCVLLRMGFLYLLLLVTRLFYRKSKIALSISGCLDFFLARRVLLVHVLALLRCTCKGEDDPVKSAFRGVNAHSAAI
jgi:hypothetical protein